MQKNLHFFGGGGYGVDMQLIFPGHTVDLRDRIMLIQYLCDLRQTAWRCFDLKIAGYRSADLLGIDNGRVFLDNALLLQSLNPSLYRNS